MAAVKEKEDYEALAKAYAPTFKAINSLQERGTITVSGVEYELELFLVADYKVCII